MVRKRPPGPLPVVEQLKFLASSIFVTTPSYNAYSVPTYGFATGSSTTTDTFTLSYALASLVYALATSAFTPTPVTYAIGSITATGTDA